MLKGAPRKTPLILAHRGASARAPENTLAAFQLARELDADGIEFDVQLSRDQVPVVIHDDTLDRTTNGHGAVRALTIHELKQFDAGAWKSPKFRGETIPSLAEAFDTLADWIGTSARARSMKRGAANVELKSTGIRTNGLEKRVINLIAQKGLEDRVIISSFNPLSLARVKALNPRIRRGLLYAPRQSLYLRRAWLRFLAAPHALHPHHSVVTGEYMKWAMRKRYPVNTWTVDDAHEARRLASLGVNAIITNEPDEIRRALEGDG